MSTASLFSCFGDIIELDFPQWDITRTKEILDAHTEWKQYNPRKSVNRYGLSVTSLDGGYSGKPDLDSLIEYNKENGTNIDEKDFKVKTPIVDQIPELANLIAEFEPGLHRSHFLRLDAGGHFPPHRDNGQNVPSYNMRIIVPLLNVGKHSWKWLQEDRVIYFEQGKTYCVNTTKEHSVFSFVDNCVILVLNVSSAPAVLRAVTAHLAVR